MQCCPNKVTVFKAATVFILKSTCQCLLVFQLEAVVSQNQSLGQTYDTRLLIWLNVNVKTMFFAITKRKPSLFISV